MAPAADRQRTSRTALMETKRKAAQLKERYRRMGRTLIAISAPTPYAATVLEALGYEFTCSAGGVTGSAMIGIPENGAIRA
jgi:hypothetical protein